MTSQQQYTGIVATDDAKPRDNTPAPSGSHLARCVQIIDNGTHTTEFAGEAKRRRTISVGWEVYPEDDDGEIMRNADGEFFLVWENWTLSMNEKSKMFQRVESWLGRSLRPEEKKSFEAGSLLDQPCRINIIHNNVDKGGVTRTYANVSSVSPAKPREVAGLPDRGADIVFFSIAKPDMAVFETFADWRKEKITHAEEWKGERFVSQYGDDAAPAPVAPFTGGEIRGCLEKHSEQTGSNARGPWTAHRFGLKSKHGPMWFGTFDEALAARLIPAVGTGVEVTVELAQGQRGLDLVDVIDAGDLQTQDGGWGEDEVL